MEALSSLIFCSTRRDVTTNYESERCGYLPVSEHDMKLLRRLLTMAFQIAIDGHTMFMGALKPSDARTHWTAFRTTNQCVVTKAYVPVPTKEPRNLHAIVNDAVAFISDEAYHSSFAFVAKGG